MSIYQVAILKEFIKLKISEYRKFYAFMEDSIKRAEGEYHKWYSGLTKNLSPERKAEFESVYADDLSTYSSYRQTLYSSFLIIVFSFFESALNTICRNIEHLKVKTGIKIKLDDIKDRGTERAKIYLTKIGNCPDSLFRTTYWQEIKIMQDIRNAFVHNEGRILKGEKGEKIKRYIKDNPRFLQNPLNEVSPILIKRSYCLFSLRNIEEFLKLLLKDVHL